MTALFTRRISRTLIGGERCEDLPEKPSPLCNSCVFECSIDVPWKAVGRAEEMRRVSPNALKLLLLLAQALGGERHGCCHVCPHRCRFDRINAVRVMARVSPRTFWRTLSPPPGTGDMRAVGASV